VQCVTDGQRDFSELEQYTEDAVWMFALRAQISLTHSKIKASKKEIQSLTSAAAQWNSIHASASATGPRANLLVW